MAEPTLDQLANFAAVTLFGPAALHQASTIKGLMERRPELELAWRNHHADVQRAIDEEPRPS